MKGSEDSLFGEVDGKVLSSTFLLKLLFIYDFTVLFGLD